MTIPQPRPAADVMRELAELEAKATGGTWYVVGPFTEEESCVSDGIAASIQAVYPPNEDGDVDTAKPLEELAEDDAEFLAAARNSLRYLLCAEAEMRAWRAFSDLQNSDLASYRKIKQARAATDSAAREIGVVVT